MAKLAIKPIMNSEVEEVLAFKTCCGLRAFDQNLEVQIRNEGKEPVTLRSHLDLITPDGPYRVANLMPNGPQLLAPGALMAFYCTMDEELWNRASELVLEDAEGARYEVVVEHQRERGLPARAER